MSDTKWTEEQLRVIETSGKDLLVSAAAGSGKTAVLVERIIQKILDPKAGIDVDRLLVVTFTNAAAREMKQRIRLAIEAESMKDPGNERLLRQKTLIHHAQITTIDSFCMYIIRNHFDEIGLDPAFRVADKTEIDLLISDTLEEVFSKHYEGDEEFLELVRLYGSKNTDNEVMELVKKLYFNSLSFPWPEKYLDQVLMPYESESVDEIVKEPWMTKYFTMLQGDVEHFEQAVNDFQLLVEESGEEYAPYIQTAEEDKALVLPLKQANDLPSFLQALSDVKFPRMVTLKKGTFDEDVKKELMDVRRDYKKIISDMQEKLSPNALSELLSVFQEIRPRAQKLVSLTKEFSLALQENKKEKNILDFSDIEHYALDVLVDEEGQPKPIALEFQEQFQEIMIDEYQDSNEVQELLLSSISGEKRGHFNYFMVGDVKQSIYRFRQARPEIFVGKYKSYDRDLSKDHVRIDLTRNFRSRKNVLDFTNDIFDRIMAEDMGGVNYDGPARLNLGANNYPEVNDSFFKPEVLMGSKEQYPIREYDITSSQEFEANIIADRIVSLIREGHVTDKESGKLRSIRPGDIVILLRSIDTLADKITEALSQKNIPSHVMTDTGYFDSPEVETILSFLYVIDNPLQDIPMTAVLHSPMFGISDDTLLDIRNEYPETAFYQAVWLYMESHPNEESLLRFRDLFQELREDAVRLPIYELIQKILDRTGYLDYVSALPGGRQRRANLEKMIDLAVTFESGNGHSVFSFILYIRKMRKFDVPMGRAEVSEGEEAAVSIMTIHKSKGLEFPVVFLSGAGKGFNSNDYSDKMLIHPTEGMALDYIHGDYKRKRKYLYKDALATIIQSESKGEELRVLYVALTRAKEKLIVTGIPGAKDIYHTIDQNRNASFYEKMHGKSYLEWILMALSTYPGRYIVKEITPDQLVLNLTEVMRHTDEKKEHLNQLLKQADPRLTEVIDERLGYQYPMAEEKHKIKYSVSELKHEAMEANALADTSEEAEEMPFLKVGAEESRNIENNDSESINEEDNSFDEREDSPYDSWTDYVDGVEVSQGALRGTAMHRFMELLDFTKDGPYSLRELEDAKKAMLLAGRMTLEEGKLLNLNKIYTFTQSELYTRMHEAAMRGELYREAPFVLGVPEEALEDPKMLLEVDAQGRELILIQGTIDAYFIEKDHVVLVDYKTDRIEKGEDLVRRYKRQVEWYALALEKAYHLTMDEACLYSFRLDESVPVFL